MLMVSEIFRSIQGESTFVGLPCAFVRLAGCNLHCRWCDTDCAHEGGRAMSIPAILKKIAPMRCRLAEVTGGEPLIQAEACTLITQLIDTGHTTLVETNGSIHLGPLDARAVKIVDVKCPASGECGSFLEKNLLLLRPGDQLKFVIASREDFEWSSAFIKERSLEGRVELLLSAVHGELSPATLAGWLLASGLWARLQLPLQKYLWPERRRGV